MKLVIITALIAVCGAAKLDRTYLPPPSAKTAGGSAGELQAPRNSFNNGLGGLPKGSYENEFQGVVVDAVTAGVRASEPEVTGLGGPRISYGSTDSKVGSAAFKTQPSAFQANGQPASQFQGSQDFGSQSFTGSQGFQKPQGFSSNGGNSQGFQSPQPSGFNSQNPKTSQGSSNPERARASLDRQASILRYENEVGPENYHFAFETDNGITAEENGQASNGVQAQGGFSYTGDDGQIYSVSYTADERGYQPKGDHLPTPPPIPEEILRSLEQNAKDEAAGLIDDGSYDAQKYNAGSDYSENENTNGKYQSTKFGGVTDTVSSGTFIDQNQEFRKPNRGQNEFNRQGSTLKENGQSNRLSQQGNYSPNNDVDRQSMNSFDRQSSNKFSTQSGQSSNRFDGQLQQTSSTGSSDDDTSSKQPVQASTGIQGQSNKFGSFSSASVQSSIQGTQEQSRPIGNKKEYLPPNRFNGRPQNARPQTPGPGNTQNGRPQSPVTVDNSDKEYNEKEEEGSGNFVPLGQQDLQSGSRPQQAVTSFGQPISNTNGFMSQNGLSSNIRNRPSNGRQPSNDRRPSNENSFVQTQTSPAVNTNGPNEYLPPRQSNQPSRPFNQPQGTTQFSQQYSSNTDSDNIEQTQNQSAFPTSPAFASRPQQTNAFQIPQSSKPKQNGNRYQSQSQVNGASSQTSLGFTSQKSTAQPATELTTPFIAHNEGPDSTGALANSPSSSNPANDRLTQASFANQYSNTHNEFGSPSSSQSSRPFGQTQAPVFPTQASAGPFGQNSQFGNRPRPLGFSPSSETQYAASTQRPTYTQQQQGPDDSYIYNQPPRPFSTPQGSRFPSAPSSQFNRITQQSTFSQSQSSSLPQDIPSTAMPVSRPKGSTRYPRPPSLAPPAPTSQSQGQFGSQSNNYGSTKYPRPPTLAPMSPTFSSQSQYQANVNGVTQASISSFPPQSPTQLSQYNAQSQFGSNVNYQQSQFGQNTQPSTPFAQQPTQSSFSQQTTASAFSKRPSQFQPQAQTFEEQDKETDKESEPIVPSQQYTGEIYEYNKPAQTLPPPDSTPATSTGSQGKGQFSSSRPQFGQTNDLEDQRPTSQFGGSGQQFSAQAGPQSRPQFSQNTQSQNKFDTQPQQTAVDMKPYGALAQSMFGSTNSRPQFGSQSRPQFVQNSFSQNDNTSPEDTKEPLAEKNESENESSDAEVTPSLPPKYRPGFEPSCCKNNAGAGKPGQSQNLFENNNYVQSQNQFGTQTQFNQNQSKPSSIEPICCKNNAGARKPGQSQPVGFQTQSSQTSFSGDQNQPTNSVGGQGEEFGGPRQPPSFDQETGYHY